ncbi:MAG: type II secretion system protein [Rhodoferax sp.]|jgi:MSHA pilin protein MshD|nr:type II secretion system protein [Rhodoferax sp.]MBK7546837.1 type II secretion system protein [Rhodoferax sp.]
MMRGARTQRGFTLIELIMFIVVISGALAGVLTIFIQATRGSADPQLRRQAMAIAESLLEEVQLMPFTYCDPDDAAAETATSAAGCTTAEALGPEAGETRTASPQFDNVNDYNGYTMASGITSITGTTVPGLSAYSASVGVQAAALGSVPGTDALRITVTVTGPGGTQVKLEGWRTRFAPTAIF